MTLNCLKIVMVCCMRHTAYAAICTVTSNCVTPVRRICNVIVKKITESDTSSTHVAC